MGTSIHQTDLA